jgi:hypothetical protein
MMDILRAVGRLIQQINAAEGKSPACEDPASSADASGISDESGRKKTRPSAQYNANDLASPGY